MSKFGILTSFDSINRDSERIAFEIPSWLKCSYDTWSLFIFSLLLSFLIDDVDVDIASICLRRKNTAVMVKASIYGAVTSR